MTSNKLNAFRAEKEHKITCMHTDTQTKYFLYTKICCLYSQHTFMIFFSTKSHLVHVIKTFQSNLLHPNAVILNSSKFFINLVWGSLH